MLLAEQKTSTPALQMMLQKKIVVAHATLMRHLAPLIPSVSSRTESALDPSWLEAAWPTRHRKQFPLKTANAFLWQTLIHPLKLITPIMALLTTQLPLAHPAGLGTQCQIQAALELMLRAGAQVHGAMLIPAHARQQML